MSIIEQMLTGQIDMPEFIAQFKSDIQLQNQIRDLIPESAKNNPSHELWERIYYGSFKNNDFDFVRFLHWICRFDGTMGDNLNIFSVFQSIYTFYQPNIKCTMKYEKAFNLYLAVVRDCYDGPEVQHIVEAIINNALPLKTKAQRIKQAKQDIEEQFHIADTKRPRWIQGPEWPMGKNSPMAFLSQKRKGELVQYSFVDVDTSDEKIVEQYY